LLLAKLDDRFYTTDF